MFIKCFNFNLSLDLSRIFLYLIKNVFISRNLKTGSVYDVVGFAKNQYGWSDHSKTFTFFKKGVGKF